MTITDGPHVVRRLLADKPVFHPKGAALRGSLPGALAFLATSVRDGDVTLEVGAGMSTVVFAAAGARRTVISPDPEEHRLIREYCDRSRIDHSRVRFIGGRSEDVLPAILGRDRTLDLAFIDGAHSYPAPVTDWFYVTRSLKAGGTLVMDCVYIPSVGQTFRHMQLEQNWRLDEILDDRTAVFTMLAPPSPRDDWKSQPFNRAYPDFSFARLHLRPLLRARWRARHARSTLTRRYPGLTRMYRRMQDRE
jgi:predicted O-methyltransferase YrrM